MRAVTGYGRTVGRRLHPEGSSRAGSAGVLWCPALGRAPALRGSTLVETLVMMLVAGIVFLTVMDGMTLFNRLLARRTEALTAAGRWMDGYFRTVSLVSRADSMLCGTSGCLELYRSGSRSELSLRDSALVFRAGDFADTLLQGIAVLRLDTYEGAPDTVQVGFGAGFTARFPVPAPARLYRTAVDETEEGYGYEE